MSADRWEALAEKLVGYPGPAYRKAYWAHFLETGRRSQAGGDPRLADYCFGKLAAGLAEAGPGPGALAAPAPSPLERLAAGWRQDRLDRFAALLSRHGQRLSPLERDAYREKLGRLQSPGTEPFRASAGLCPGVPRRVCRFPYWR